MKEPETPLVKNQMAAKDTYGGRKQYIRFWLLISQPAALKRSKKEQ